MAVDTVNLDCLCGDSFIQSIVKVTQIVMGIVLVLCICHTVYTVFFSVYIMFGFLGPLSWGTGWKQASRPGAE